jgi:hypothetical protein
MQTGMIIRPARPGDRPAMERICVQTWEWGDYIPEVWDDWLADEQGLPIVCELEGRVVAGGDARRSRVPPPRHRPAVARA